MAKKRRKLPKVLHLPMYLAIRAVVAAVGTGELGANLRIARAAGRMFGGARMNRRRLQRAVDHLAIAFPEWSLDQREEYALKAYEHLFMLGVEMTSTGRLLTEDHWPRFAKLTDMRAPLDELLREQPCLLLTAHCGNWELLGFVMSLLGFPVTALYRPLDLKPVDDWVRTSRAARGMTLLDKFGAGEDLPGLMSRHGTPAFVSDQNAGDRGVFVPFFGRLASAYKSIGLLAIQYNCPILCGVARREETSDLRYSIHVPEVIRPRDWQDQPDPLFYVTARYRRCIESLVRLAPEQYLWMHRYWKSRPRHEHKGGDLPASLRAKLEALPWMTQTELDGIIRHTRQDAATLAAGGVPC
ncbi:MAG: lysophospholipid acyltransferase family protein [Phycisphaerales bacterium]